MVTSFLSAGLFDDRREFRSALFSCGAVPTQVHEPFERPRPTAAATLLLGYFPPPHRLLYRVFVAATIAIFRDFVAEVVVRQLSIPLIALSNFIVSSTNPRFYSKLLFPKLLLISKRCNVLQCVALFHLQDFSGNVASSASLRRRILRSKGAKLSSRIS